MTSGKSKHILVAVLDWGLGHATRSIPVIRCLLENNCQVSIAGNGPSLTLLKQEFPHLSFYELAAHQVTYSPRGFFFTRLFFQTPRIFKAIRKERRQIEKLTGENQIDAIISDNRYGCYSDKVPSVLITHQLNIQLPAALSWSRFVVNYILHYWIKKFDSCWVPDFPESRLSGKLSEEKEMKVQFVGILSRFHGKNRSTTDIGVVGLVSGPEPQRTIFENLLIREFSVLNQPSLIVRGLPQLNEEVASQGDITFINHASSDELEGIISSAGWIVSRSGYSTIMDLQTLARKQVIFIPTPGQTEQEYLADNLEKRNICVAQPQDAFNLKEAMQKSKEYTGFDAIADQTNLLNEAVLNLLQRIKVAQ